MKEELREIQEYLEILCSNDPTEVQERITQLNVYMARSGELSAIAKKNLRESKAKEISKTIIAIAKQSCLSSKAQNALVDSICQEEAWLADWSERINRSCTHQIDALRSQLSYIKEELRLNKTGY